MLVREVGEMTLWGLASYRGVSRPQGDVASSFPLLRSGNRNFTSERRLAFRKLNGFLTMSDMRKTLSGQRRDAGRYVK